MQAVPAGMRWRTAGRACCRMQPRFECACRRRRAERRTTAYDDHLADCDRNGARVLPTLLHTHAPIDLILLMLGSNDMKPDHSRHRFRCGEGYRAPRQSGAAGTTGRRKRRGARNPHRLAACPLCETANSAFAAMFAGGGRAIRQCWRRFIAISPTSSTAALRRRISGQDEPSTVSTSTRRHPGGRRGLEPVVRMMLGL